MLVSLFACHSQRKEETNTMVSQEPATATVTPLTTVQHAQNFKLTYHKKFKKLQVFYKGDTLVYYLIAKGETLPEGINKEQSTIIRTPVEKIALTSTTHASLCSFLEATDAIHTVTCGEYFYDSTLLQALQSGNIQSFGNSVSINQELLFAQQPEVMIATSWSETQLEIYRMINEAGIPVVLNAEWLETSALGKAEWVKVMAALLDKEALANEKFQKVEEEYQRLAKLVENTPQSPTVICGVPYKGTWFMPGGKSFMSRLLLEAAGNYPWQQDSTTGSMQLDFEAVYPVGVKADKWIITSNVQSLPELQARDERFTDFQAYQQQEVYSNTKRTNPTTQGNDYWESGVTHPHLVLADFIKILHPERLPEHKMHYFERLN
ncbi:ABC transporter substrate-binding protein [Rapidithrix thailandica]|uniref:ABC transporter substrate-binding protein n=1 Tax=Rapidithrix thailandica TaxID=413964 RepID=A0AAW9S6E6_9BACT